MNTGKIGSSTVIDFQRPERRLKEWVRERRSRRAGKRTGNNNTLEFASSEFSGEVIPEQNKYVASDRIPVAGCITSAVWCAHSR